MASSFAASRKLLVCGNGGSATDSKHIACELMKDFCLKRKLDARMASALRRTFPKQADFLEKGLQGGLPTIALSGEEALMTAIANDSHADLVFAQQVLTLGQEGDVLLAISTSGNSANVFYAVLTARLKKMTSILLTGKTGGKIKEEADIAVCVPESECYKVQELHLPLYHAMCLALEEEFFGASQP